MVSEQQEEYNNMSIERYNNLISLDLEFLPPQIISYTPKPKEIDYTRTYIIRYFIQKANDEDSVITEISYKIYTSFLDNPFYNIVSLDWVIVGDEADVKEKNKKSILYASKTMKAIPLYLQNPLQFLKK